MTTITRAATRAGMAEPINTSAITIKLAQQLSSLYSKTTIA